MMMAKIMVKVRSNNYVGAQVVIDGELVAFRKSKDRNDPYGTMVGHVEVAKPQVKLQIGNWFELEGKHWMLYSFFFWLIGGFGFFSPRYEKRCDKLSYETTLILMEHKDDSEIDIKFLSPYKNGYAMELTSNFTTTLNNPTNCYERCTLAEKRKKIVGVLSFFSTIIAVVALSIFLVNILL